MEEFGLCGGNLEGPHEASEGKGIPGTEQEMQIERGTYSELGDLAG